MHNNALYLIAKQFCFISGTSCFTSHFTTKTMSSSLTQSPRQGIISGNHVLVVCLYICAPFLFVCFNAALSFSCLFHGFEVFNELNKEMLCQFYGV